MDLHLRTINPTKTKNSKVAPWTTLPVLTNEKVKNITKSTRQYVMKAAFILYSTQFE